jgi:hypothetical protein
MKPRADDQRTLGGHSIVVLVAEFQRRRHVMKTQRLAIALTVINLLILTFNTAHVRQATAQGVAPVLRGRALEIVDESGRVRASIAVLPAQIAKADGKLYTETVLLRLINSKGGPNVKLGASEQGAGLVLGGESAYVQILAEGPSTSLKLSNKDGREQLIKP